LNKGCDEDNKSFGHQLITKFDMSQHDRLSSIPYLSNLIPYVIVKQDRESNNKFSPKNAELWK